MAHELWISKETGIVRTGTSFKEVNDIMNKSFPVHLIAEPLYCVNHNVDPKEIYEDILKRDFDIVGVMNEYRIHSFVKLDELEEDHQKLNEHLLDELPFLDYNSSFENLFESLSLCPQCFVQKNDELYGIVTLADLNKPLVRLYTFGIISMVEMHMNFWIRHFYQSESWSDYLRQKKIDQADSTFAERKKRNLAIDKVECLQFADKKEILGSCDEFRELFGFGRSRLEKLLFRGETIRNSLAHSNSWILDKEKPKKFLETIAYLRDFLFHSEERVREIMGNQNVAES